MAFMPFPAPKVQSTSSGGPGSYAAGGVPGAGVPAAGSSLPPQTSQYVKGSASASGYVLVGGSSQQSGAMTSSGYVLLGDSAVSSQVLATSKAGAPPAKMTSSTRPQQYKQVQPVILPQQPGAFPKKQAPLKAMMYTCPDVNAIKAAQQPPALPSTQLPLQPPTQLPMPACCAQSMQVQMPYAAQCMTGPLQVHRLTFPQDEDAKKNDGAERKDLELAAVVVTVCNGHSYDDIFRRVPQQGVEGTYVATYHVAGSLAPLLAALRAQTQAAEHADHSADFHQLLEDMRAVEPGSVVVNWECCSACSDESFGGHQETATVMDLISVLLQRGHMVMCSDFSLKALIKQWSTRHLGPNPFVKLGEFGGSMHLHFDTARVAECPSAQLQRAGDLCENGRAEVHAMNSTIAYTVDHGVPAVTGAYTLEVLTIASGMPGVDVVHLPADRTCEAGGQRGAAGHVLLRYPSGGMLLASAGHWGELVHMDVTEERLLQTAAEQYGAAYAGGFASQLAAAPSAAMRAQCMQSLSSQMVSQSVPCTYSKMTSSGTSSKTPFATA